MNNVYNLILFDLPLMHLSSAYTADSGSEFGFDKPDLKIRFRIRFRYNHIRNIRSFVGEVLIPVIMLK